MTIAVHTRVKRPIRFFSLYPAPGKGRPCGIVAWFRTHRYADGLRAEIVGSGPRTSSSTTFFSGSVHTVN
jgi:hypothetical protein